MCHNPINHIFCHPWNRIGWTMQMLIPNRGDALGPLCQTSGHSFFFSLSLSLSLLVYAYVSVYIIAYICIYCYHMKSKGRFCTYMYM